MFYIIISQVTANFIAAPLGPASSKGHFYIYRLLKSKIKKSEINENYEIITKTKTI